MSYPVITQEELKWRARSDARTLAEAEEIKADKKRLELAQNGARELLLEEANRFKGLKKVASNSNTYSRGNNKATIGRL